MSAWGWLNVVVVQWFGVRLERELEDDGTLHALNIIGPIVPMTGWWSGYIPQRFARLCVWRKHL